MDAATGSLIVSVIALAVSLVAALKAHGVAKIQASAQARVAALEEARERSRLRERRSAAVSAEVVRSGKRDELVVRNTGPSGARDVRVLLDGRAVLEHTWVPPNQAEVTSLGPGAQAAYVLGLSGGSPSIAEVEITWADDSGNPGKWSSQLRAL